VCIRHEIAKGLSVNKQALQHRPVPLGRRDDSGARLIQPALHAGAGAIPQSPPVPPASALKLPLAQGSDEVYTSEYSGEDDRSFRLNVTDYSG
jgi:hypothetical protein